MTIETSYNVDDKVFRMHENKVVEDEIIAINIAVRTCADAPPDISVTYQLHFGGGGWKDYSFFRTKQELLQSL